MKFPIISFMWFLVFGVCAWTAGNDFIDGITSPEMAWFIILIMSMVTFGSRFILWYAHKMKYNNEKE